MRKYNIILVLLSIFFLMPSVEAKSATVEFEGKSTVEIGDTFIVNMVVDNIDSYDGVVSLGGNLSFDKDVLQFISAEQIDAPYAFHINTDANYKIAGLDFTLSNGIKTKTTIYSFKFKAIKEGNTEISLINQKLTDSQDYLNTTVINKTITVNEVKNVVLNNNVVKNNTQKNNKVEKDTKVEEKIENNDIKVNTENNEIKEIIEKNEIETKIIVKENWFQKQIKRIFNYFIVLFK